MSVSLPLYRLQQIDSRLKQVNTRLAAIQSILDTNSDLRAATQQLQDSKIARHQAETALKQAESETAELRIKLEIVETNLYAGRIRNPKELQDLQKEIVVLKRNLEALENEQLQRMISVDTSDQALEETQKNFDFTQGKVISANAELKSEQLTLQKESDNLLNQRLAVLPAINKNFLDLYDSLRQKRSGLAVTIVTENTCDACGSTLTPGFAQTVRTSTQLVLCPMCGRILYSN